MTNVWVLFFVLSLSVAFKLHRPTGMVKIPYGEEFKEIPSDVFWYHTFEHVGNILKACVFISMVLYPDKNHKLAYFVFLGIEVVDFGLYRLYYRDWGLPVPWNIVKVIIFGLTVLYLQWRQLLRTGVS